MSEHVIATAFNGSEGGQMTFEKLTQAALLILGAGAGQAAPQPSAIRFYELISKGVVTGGSVDGFPNFVLARKGRTSIAAYASAPLRKASLRSLIRAFRQPFV
jgi:hypothetical protein